MCEFKLTISQRRPRLSDEIPNIRERGLLLVRKVPVQAFQTRLATIKHLSSGLLGADFVHRRHTGRNLAVAGVG